MLSVAHVFVGAAIGAATGNPYLGFVAGLVSHHLLDVIPHWDIGSFYPPDSPETELNRRDKIIATIDVLAAAGLIVWLAGRFGPALGTANVVAGALGSITPDVWHHIPLWKKWSRRITAPWYRLHNRWHHTAPNSQWTLGLATQLVVIGSAWWWLAAMR